MTQFLLASADPDNQVRAVFDSDKPADDLYHDLKRFADAANVRLLGIPQQATIIAGPDHPHFADAIAAHNLRHLPLGSLELVSTTLRLLVVSGMLPPENGEDDCLITLIRTALSLPEDWKSIDTIADVISRHYLAEHFTGFDAAPAYMLPETLRALHSFTGGLVVALTTARLTRESSL